MNFHQKFRSSSSFSPLIFLLLLIFISFVKDVHLGAVSEFKRVSSALFWHHLFCLASTIGVGSFDCCYYRCDLIKITSHMLINLYFLCLLLGGLWSAIRAKRDEQHPLHGAAHGRAAAVPQSDMSLLLPCECPEGKKFSARENLEYSYTTRWGTHWCPQFTRTTYTGGTRSRAQCYTSHTSA